MTDERTSREDPRDTAWADPTPERLRHAEGWTVGNARDRRDRKVTIIDPFEAACDRGQFTAKQQQAGAKFRHHWERGQLYKELSSMDMDAIHGEPHGRILWGPEEVMQHRLQYRNAEKLLGMVETSLLMWVLCEGMILQEAGERVGRWKDRKQASAAAVQLMRASLDRLCGLWGI